MSIFNCDKCGCIENTATSEGGWLLPAFVKARQVPEDVQASWRKVLGLTESAKFGHYCSVCCPIWYNPCTCGHAPHLYGYNCYGYGMGPNPNPRKWHDIFPREYGKVQ
jgi:hypothetical protein